MALGLKGRVWHGFGALVPQWHSDGTLRVTQLSRLGRKALRHNPVIEPIPIGMVNNHSVPAHAIRRGSTVFLCWL